MKSVGKKKNQVKIHYIINEKMKTNTNKRIKMIKGQNGGEPCRDTGCKGCGHPAEQLPSILYIREPFRVSGRKPEESKNSSYHIYVFLSDFS